MTTRISPKILRLGDDQADRLGEALRDLRYPFDGPFAPYVEATRIAVASVLTVSQRALIASLPELGTLVIDNLPVDAGVTHGPVDPEAAVRVKETDISEGALCGFVAQLGVPYAVVQEGRSLISNVAARRDRIESLTGLGAVPLDLHVENAFGRTFVADRSPAGLALIGVCREPGTSPATPVADARVALRMLPAAQAAILAQPRFLIRRPERWRGAGKLETQVTPIFLALDRPAFIIATYGTMIEALDPDAWRALQAFEVALAQVAVDVVIVPRRLVLISNLTQLHGRRGYTPSFTAQGAPYRWLQRLFWTDSLDNFGGWRIGDHLIDASRPD